MTAVKICGLRCAEDVACVNAGRPDLAGFVFYPGSARCVTPAQAAALSAQLAPGIIPVGVFVDADPALIADLAAQGVIRLAQLHGHEDAAYLARLRALTSVPVMQAFLLRTPADAAAAQDSAADLILLDSGRGSGRTFDWSLAAAVERDYFLSGGLTPENVGAAIARLHPYGVDVSSGVETGPRKDPEKVRRFLAAAGH